MVRVNVNVTFTESPALPMTTWLLSGLTSKPGTLAATFQVPGSRPVNVRAIVALAVDLPLCDGRDVQVTGRHRVDVGTEVESLALDRSSASR